MQRGAQALDTSQHGRLIVHETSNTDGLATVCADFNGRIANLLAEETSDPLVRGLQQQTRLSLEAAQDALTRYSLEQLCLSYNGGKDCLVLLIIYLAALHTHWNASSSSPPSIANANGHASINTSTVNGSAEHHSFPQRLQSVYIQPSHPFHEVDDFVESSAADYHLDLASSALPMKAAFAEYLEQHKKVKAIFVGTRRTDPHGGSLTHFDQTDRGWPSFMRIHPVIDWHYREIWAFIRHFDIPYCSLYDMGFTSLGGIQDTQPNPRLLKPATRAGDGREEARYRPAYELQLDDEERLGRA